MRKQTLVIRLLERVFIVSFAAILVILPVHALLSTWGGTTIGPLLLWKSWKEVLLLVLLPLVIWYLFLRPNVARAMFRSRLNQVILIFFGLIAGYTVVSPASGDAAIAGLLIDLRFIAIFLLGQLIALGRNQWVARLQQMLPTWLLVTMGALGVLSILQIYVLPQDFLNIFGYGRDTISPVTLLDDNPNAPRAFATMRGPNTLGSYLLLPLALAIYLMAKRQKIWLAGATVSLGFIALVLSGSRSAWLGAGAAALLLGVYLSPQAKRHWLRLAILPVAAVGIIGAWAATSVPAVRLAIFHSSPGDPSLVEGSSEKHWQATVDGMKDIATNPLGQGIGTAGPASFYNDKGSPKISENFFVQVGQEAGVLAVFLLVAIMWLLALRLGEISGMMPQVLLASFAGLTLINMFLHGWADDPTAMTWWGLAGIYAAHSPGKKPK